MPFLSLSQHCQSTANINNVTLYVALLPVLILCLVYRQAGALLVAQPTVSKL